MLVRKENTVPGCSETVFDNSDIQAFPTLPQTSIFCMTYFLTSSRPAALYFFGSIVSGFALSTDVTPFVKAILRSVA